MEYTYDSLHQIASSPRLSKSIAPNTVVTITEWYNGDYDTDRIDVLLHGNLILSLHDKGSSGDWCIIQRGSFEWFTMTTQARLALILGSYGWDVKRRDVNTGHQNWVFIPRWRQRLGIQSVHMYVTGFTEDDWYSRVIRLQESSWYERDIS